MLTLRHRCGSSSSGGDLRGGKCSRRRLPTSCDGRTGGPRRETRTDRRTTEPVEISLAWTGSPCMSGSRYVSDRSFMVCSISRSCLSFATSIKGTCRSTVGPGPWIVSKIRFANWPPIGGVHQQIFQLIRQKRSRATECCFRHKTRDRGCSLITCKSLFYPFEDKFKVSGVIDL